MGHTLVTRFTDEGYSTIQGLLESNGVKNVNKIPFGRSCDRTVANSILPYHVTMAHWKKPEDKKYLAHLSAFKFSEFKITFSKTVVWRGAEGSWILALSVKPTKGFRKTEKDLRKAFNKFFYVHKPHLTISVSKDKKEIEAQREAIKSAFPITLDVVGLDLYKIWNPVEFVRSYSR